MTIYTVIPGNGGGLITVDVEAFWLDPDTNLFFKGGFEVTALFISSFSFFMIRFSDILFNTSVDRVAKQNTKKKKKTSEKKKIVTSYIFYHVCMKIRHEIAL